MLKSLLLMITLKIASITTWVKQTRTITLFAILTGFNPDDTPGIGTYYDFMKRIINGPYKKACEHLIKRSTLTTGKHKRNIPLQTNAAAQGQSTCTCRSEGKYNCQHDRLYLSPTAKELRNNKLDN